MRLHQFIIASFIMLSNISVAYSATIFEQSVDFNYPLGYFSDHNWRMYDDFILSSDSIINRLTFWGVYWEDGVVPSPTLFDITFGDSLSNLSNIYNATLTASITDTGFVIPWNPIPHILEFVVDLPDSVFLAGNQQYFLGIYANSNPITNDFAWMLSSWDGWFQVQGVGPLNSTVFQPYSGNTSFRLSNIESSSSIFEPSTITLMALGFTGMVASRNRPGFLCAKNVPF